jgi:hypothetical protein
MASSRSLLTAIVLQLVEGGYCFGRWCDAVTTRYGLRIADWRIADGRTLEIQNVLGFTVHGRSSNRHQFTGARLRPTNPIVMITFHIRTILLFGPFRLSRVPIIYATRLVGYLSHVLFLYPYIPEAPDYLCTWYIRLRHR